MKENTDEKEERKHYYNHLYFACECAVVQTERQPPLLTHRADEGYAKEAQLTRWCPSAPRDHHRQEATVLKTLLLAHKATNSLQQDLQRTLSNALPLTNQLSKTNDAPIESPTAGSTANGGTLIGLVSTGVSLKFKQSKTAAMANIYSGYTLCIGQTLASSSYTAHLCWCIASALAHCRKDKKV